MGNLIFVLLDYNQFIREGDEKIGGCVEYLMECDDKDEDYEEFNGMGGKAIVVFMR